MVSLIEKAQQNATSDTWLVDALLEEQQRTAVERFSQFHEEEDGPLQARYYQDLIPLTTPEAGQQYAFEVDLDACSGCKACVAACHNLNGLEDTEVWRNVGVLQGGDQALPVIQHVTTACHHCIDPGCLTGCPVKAYEKDPVTGIVRHLDDQCIGCRYCMLKCPYDVPVYSKEKGIVRKCDMCHQRLSAGEAPACVQSCPNEAIRIRIVNHQDVIEESQTNQFLPTAPEPGYTLPTTSYKTSRSLPRNLLPTDYYSASKQHGHLPLVIMLVLTQLSLGTFALQFFRLAAAGGEPFGQSSAGMLHMLTALGAGFLGLFAAIFHLGRPLYAYRSLLGLRTSWMSREILMFGVYAGLVTTYVGLAFANSRFAFSTHGLQQMVGVGAILSGIAAIACSVMIYVDTRRPFWDLPTTTLKFFLTCAILGGSATLLASTIVEIVAPERGQLLGAAERQLATIVLLATSFKLLIESSVFLHLRERQHTPLKRTAQLLRGELGLTSLRRLFCGVVGGLLLPSILLAEATLARVQGFHPAFVMTIAGLSFALLLVGELMERFLFFAASLAPKMPGAPATM